MLWLLKAGNCYIGLKKASRNADAEDETKLAM
jgi:hypothetical protein